MVTKTTTSRPLPRSSSSSTHPHAHAQLQRTSSKTTSTPLTSSPRLQPPAASVGQSLPPNSNHIFLRSPGTRTDPRTPSPNYFGLRVDPVGDPRDSSIGPKDNWSSPTSSIRSFGATSPKHLPLDANPEFEAFRRQTESKTPFTLSHGQFSHLATVPPVTGPTRQRASSRSDVTSVQSSDTEQHPRDSTPDRMDIDSGDSRDKPSASKRGSDGSLKTSGVFDTSCQGSPLRASTSPSYESRPAASLQARDAALQRNIENQAPSSGDEPQMLNPARLKDILEHSAPSEFLLLDLRVFPQFSASRIKGALNLCIPTTLLKRPSFDIKKLQETFASEVEKERFSQWKTARYLVVYDAASSDKKDATSSINTLKKFAIEGWNGSSYIVQGGFQRFSRLFPGLVDDRPSREMQSSAKNGLSVATQLPGVAPVAGGCAMPATENAANPFFSNIRQNQDLIGGVGQIDITMPDLGDEAETILPAWLSQAAAPKDHGKKVSEKFLGLELAEQSRMTKALSSRNSHNYSNHNEGTVQITGLEKGSKNRYNNIWPFEHARVKLQGRTQGTCDYINASHITSLRSNKRYIASQGPLPTTFEDFWTVVWEQDVRVIVMLTAEQEGGQLKCHPYWASKEFGPLKLRHLSEKRMSLEADSRKHDSSTSRTDRGRRRASTLTEDPSLTSPGMAERPYVTVRKFTLSHASHPFSPMREITQVQYSSWPDFGAPASPRQVLGLVELTNQMQRAALSVTQSPRSSEPESGEVSRPLLVHCSAGCGRTGTFCTIDSVIDMLKRQRLALKSGSKFGNNDFPLFAERRDTDPARMDWIFDPSVDLVQKTVEDFRGQRLSMVQSLKQYVLCYETVLEWVAQQAPRHADITSRRERSDSSV